MLTLVWARSACYGLTVLRPTHPPLGKGKSVCKGLRTVLSHALRMPHAAAIKLSPSIQILTL
ncbi:MAG: hypothetical protein RML94_08770 [Bacteroidia bacterium]|nr:hypothetical protein [Bacteroidia bacterium]